jgi:hypothetical protein
MVIIKVIKCFKIRSSLFASIKRQPCRSLVVRTTWQFIIIPKDSHDNIFLRTRLLSINRKPTYHIHSIIKIMLAS